MRIAIALTVGIVAVLAVGLYFSAKHQDQAQHTVWMQCSDAAFSRFPPDDGVNRKTATFRKIDDSIEACFLIHGYRFDPRPPCDPTFPSRREAPFCYAPTKWKDRQLFKLNYFFQRCEFC